jgi:hypothetical protein
LGHLASAKKDDADHDVEIEPWHWNEHFTSWWLGLLDRQNPI